VGELGLCATVPVVLQYPRVLITPRLWRQLGLEGRRERRPRGFAHGRQERRVFPSNLLLDVIDTSHLILSLNLTLMGLLSRPIRPGPLVP
jgi:hypothetical protein